MILNIDQSPEPKRDFLGENRRFIEQLGQLAEFLPPPHDRIAYAMLVEGQTLACVARNLGMDWMAAKRLYRRLVRRLVNPPFRLVVRHFDRLTTAEQSLAQRAVLAGQSLRRVAIGLGLSIHMVRKQLAGLLAKLVRLEQDYRDDGGNQ